MFEQITLTMNYLHLFFKYFIGSISTVQDIRYKETKTNKQRQKSLFLCIIIKDLTFNVFRVLTFDK